MRLISGNRKPQRGLIEVASQFIGWYAMEKNMRAFRYATSNPYRVPTARYLLTYSLPANELAGYPYLMPTASNARTTNQFN